jgi:hypothetical protein
MARTKRNAMQIEEARKKIQTTQLVNRLTNHAVGKVDMSATQVSAALGLLKKSLPDLQSVEMKSEVEITNDVAVPRPTDYEAWLKYVDTAGRRSNGSDPDGAVH